MMSESERDERRRHLVEYGADRLWQPVVDAVLNVYQKFDKGFSECNTVLLITERHHFHDFYAYYLEPALPKGAVLFLNSMSGYGLRKRVETIEHKVIFLLNGIDWHANKFAPKESRAKSVRDLLEAARRGRKFLILCGYDHEMNRLRELLSIAFPDGKPEIKEFVLKPVS